MQGQKFAQVVNTGAMCIPWLQNDVIYKWWHVKYMSYATSWIFNDQQVHTCWQKNSKHKSQKYGSIDSMVSKEIICSKLQRTEWLQQKGNFLSIYNKNDQINCVDTISFTIKASAPSSLLFFFLFDLFLFFLLFFLFLLLLLLLLLFFLLFLLLFWLFLYFILLLLLLINNNNGYLYSANPPLSPWSVYSIYALVEPKRQTKTSCVYVCVRARVCVCVCVCVCALACLCTSILFLIIMFAV